jgi:TolB-like protein
MELCHGARLKDLIADGPLDIGPALSIVLQVADALSEAHKHQIVHRDVKSSNIMVDARNRAKLLDFGLATLFGAEDATQTIGLMGTPAYMAPERFESNLADNRTDIWALGVVLFEAISGQSPFAGPQARLVHAILNEYPPPISSLRSGVPPELDEVIDRALAKNPEDRYQAVEDLMADLMAIQSETSRTPAGPSTGASRTGATSIRLSNERERVHAVAVLPFVNMSNNADNEYLSDGLTEEIINALTQVQGLRVVSRASVFQFKAAALDLRDVGRRLRVGALVLGSVRRNANRVRVTAQLVKAADGYQMWSERFDCEMKDVFDVEDQLTGAILENLKKRLGTDLEPAHSRGHTSNFDAHELYLRARHSFNQQTAAGVADALRHFSQALNLAPNYALAHVGLADCYALQGWYGLELPKDVMPKAKAALETALRIEEALPQAWCLRAAIATGFDWNWEQARHDFQQAFALGSPTSDLHFHHALDFLTPLRRLDDALEEIKLAMELDPLAPLIGTALGGCLYRSRRYSAALQQLQSTIELDPNFYHAHWTMARVYESKRQFPQALECFERAYASSGKNPAVLADWSHCHGVMGEDTAARNILARLCAAAAERYVSPLALATAYLGLGERQPALDHLARAVEERARGLIWLNVDPRFEALTHEAAFRNILAPIGLA